ncbi:MAG: TonB-dependent receptor [Pseudomonadota bacterium]
MKHQWFMGAAMLAGLSTAAAAQEENEPIRIADASDEIVVVGTKQNLTVQETDVSVEVFNEERIAREALFSIDDILLRTPGVTFTGATSSLTIRGISRDGVSGGGQGVTSNIYLDGVPIATTALSFGFDSLWDIGQVEVLRGPQSTVQGRNALAGAIVISTNDPTYDWEFRGRARYAEFDTQQFASVISGPIIDDQLAFRVAVDYQSTDGFIDNVFADSTANDNQNLLVRTKLLLEPDFLPKLRTELTFEYGENERGTITPIVNAPVGVVNPGSPGVPPGFGLPPAPPVPPFVEQEFLDFNPFDFQSFDDFERNDTETIRAIADIEYELTENITLKGLGTFEDVDRFRLLGDLDDLSLFQTNGFNQDDVRTYSGEISAIYDFGRWSGNLGAYYFTSNEDFFFSLTSELATVFPPVVVFNPADSLFATELPTETDTENFAFYGQTRFELNDRWTFSFGIRYDREEFATTGTTSQNLVLLTPGCTATAPGVAFGFPGFDPVTLPCEALAPPLVDSPPQTNTFDAILPRGSVTYNFTDDLSVFFSAQRGYRAGGTFAQTTAIDGVPTTLIGTFDPEFLVNYEIGFRSQWFDRALTFNGNLFLSEFSEQQVQLPGPTGGPLDFFTANTAQSSSMGVELSADYSPSDNLNFFGSLTLLDTEFDDFPFATAGPEDGPFFNLAGNEFSNAPTVQFSIGASYEHNTGLFGDISLSHTGSVNSGVENLTEAEFADAFVALGIDPALAAGVTEESDSRTLVNGRLGWRQDNFEFAVFVTNLFDEQATLLANPASVLPTGDVNFFDTPAFTIVQPQTFGVSFDVRF